MVAQTTCSLCWALFITAYKADFERDLKKNLTKIFWIFFASGRHILFLVT